MPHHKLAIWTRFVGVLLIAAGAVLCATQAYALLNATPEHLLDYGVRAVAYLLAGIGIGSGLIAIGAILKGKTDSSGGLLAPLKQIQSQVDELNVRIGALSADVERNNSGTPAAPQLDPEALVRIEDLLHEVRELSLLGDSDRRARLSHHLDQRKRVMSRQVMDLVNNNEFGKAEKILIELEAQFPGDVHSVGCRRDLNTARKEKEAKLLVDNSAKIENLASIGAWEQALAAANRLVVDLPASAEAGELLARVVHERELFIETVAQSLYDEVRKQVEQRQWRQALAGAQKLLSKYPTHPRGQQIRQQLRTIQENADIEERHIAEVQIQEMIRAGQFRDAIDLAEDIIHRFPGSPQADAVEAMLPRLQELAGEPQTPVA